MSQLDPIFFRPRSLSGPTGAQAPHLKPIHEPGVSIFLTNPLFSFRMVSTLGKRKAAVSSNELQADFKDQLSNRRKPEEDHPQGEKSKPVPILIG